MQKNTAGKKIPLTNFLSRHPITYSDESEVDSKTDRREETEAEEEFVINQIYGLFEFNRTVGNKTQFIERTTAPQRAHHPQCGRQTRERSQTGQSLEALSNSISIVNKQPLKVSMDKVNGIDIEFILKKRTILPR